MDKNLFNISKIETFLNTLFDNKVSDNTFFSDLPPAIKQEWKDMVVVDIPSMYDLSGMGNSRINVFLYARPKSNGTKNVPVLSAMESKLRECIANNTDVHYQLSINNEWTDYDDQRDLHCNIYELILKIF